MNIRALNPGDIKELKKIHEQFFKEEFKFPDFLKGFHCAFVAEDNEGIIAAGGIRPIAEIIAITNKNRSLRARYNALSRFLLASMYFAKEFNYDAIHTFVQDERWQSQLERKGFSKTMGQSLSMDLEH